MSLIFLTEDDFTIFSGRKGPEMCVGIQNFSLILFYSNQCSYCQSLIPIFKNLPNAIGNCHFGMVNISNNRGLVALSQQTTTPLTYVPYIVLYINGHPFMLYEGPPDINIIGEFIHKVANDVRSRQAFVAQTVKNPDTGRREIPAYTVGHPVRGHDNRCYLNYDNAY